ncbi:MAG: tRNA glutamyl-Q(34) synthetase GluQRS [Alphaproteobacteria bacterium]|nr:tRNA glutamyl-Q(34) synthetase GluQRS [Alphaproteobacteria bacterium]
MIVTRFAPSPTGALHLGHAASALFAFRKAQEAGGQFLLRVEDIDPVRCKPAFVEGIYEDLAWLGLFWPTPVRKQSEHRDDYQAALSRLEKRGLIYPCFCTRKEVLAEAAAAGYAPHGWPQDQEGPVYPGTCRSLSQVQRQDLGQTRQAVWRLDMQKAVESVGGPLLWVDLGVGEVIARPERFGDVVLARKDVPMSYHLSVVVDDALQGVTLVTRGEDLFPVTDIHRLLQALLDLPVPVYHHHALLKDAAGKRFAKRDQANTLLALRESGLSCEDVRALALRDLGELSRLS